MFPISVESKIHAYLTVPLDLLLLLTFISTHLPSEFTLPPRYLWNPFTIFFTTCSILIQATLISHPDSFPLSLHCTQSSLLKCQCDCVIMDHPLKPYSLVLCTINSQPPHSWSPSPKWFDLWLFSLLFLSTLPFIPTSSLLEYSYTSQTVIDCLLYFKYVLRTSDVSMNTTVKMPCCQKAQISVIRHCKSFC